MTSEAADSQPAKTRVIVAGAGLFGREHLQRLAARSDVEIAGVADPDPAAAKLVRDRFGVTRCLASARDLVATSDADAIIVASPLSTHVEIAIAALERGMNVLLEKPIAPSAAAAEPLVATAAATGRLVLPGHVLRFSADHRRVVDIVRSGVIGRPLYLSSRRYRDEDHARRYADTDPVLMTMIHDIDLAVWIAGTPFRSVRAHRSAGAGQRTLTTIGATNEAGVICELRTAWTFPGESPPPDRLEVVGERGSVELVVGRSIDVHRDGKLESVPVDDSDDPLALEIAHFIAASRDRRITPLVPLDDAISGLKLADAVFRSIACGREEAVAP